MRKRVISDHHELAGCRRSDLFSHVPTERSATNLHCDVIATSEIYMCDYFCQKNLFRIFCGSCSLEVLPISDIETGGMFDFIYSSTFGIDFSIASESDSFPKAKNTADKIGIQTAKTAGSSCRRLSFPISSCRLS